jgi:CheY-like chemotaxis protein
MVAQSIHVAILDDDPSIRTALARLLKAEGMVVASYATSDQLLDALALSVPNLLLLDFQMPGMNGLDVLKVLGQRQMRIPTIMITAHDAPGLRSACLNAGAVAYLNKPISAGQLVPLIQNITGASQNGPLPFFDKGRVGW